MRSADASTDAATNARLSGDAALILASFEAEMAFHDREGIGGAAELLRTGRRPSGSRHSSLTIENRDLMAIGWADSLRSREVPGFCQSSKRCKAAAATAKAKVSDRRTIVDGHLECDSTTMRPSVKRAWCKPPPVAVTQGGAKPYEHSDRAEVPP